MKTCDKCEMEGIQDPETKDGFQIQIKEGLRITLCTKCWHEFVDNAPADLLEIIMKGLRGPVEGS